MPDVDRDRPTDYDRFAAGLRERQRAVTDQVLERLREQEATIEDLSRRVRVLELRAGVNAPHPTEEPRVNGSPTTPFDALEAPSNADAPPRGAVAKLFSRAARVCSVCQRPAPSRSKRELSKAGWSITGRSSVCPGCRAMGWRVSNDGGLPFRHRAMNEG